MTFVIYIVLNFKEDFNPVNKIIVVDVLNVDVSGFEFPFCKRSFAMLEY